MDEQNANKVIFIITTDGLENSSIEYNKGQIKELIQGHKNWKFIYIGADIDSYEEVQSIGIRSDRKSNYIKSRKGIGRLFSKIKDLCVMFDEEDCISEDWKDGLEEYISENKE